ncbi:MAG TPA: hypothetical protein VIH64_11590, partial [Streptosporangiaceae bacterium]
MGRDAGALDGHDRDGEDLDVAAGGSHAREQPRQLTVVGEADHVFLGHSPPVPGPGYPAKGEVGGQVRQDAFGQVGAQAFAGPARTRWNVGQRAAGSREGHGRFQVGAGVDRRVEGIPDARDLDHEVLHGFGHGRSASLRP